MPDLLCIVCRKPIPANEDTAYGHRCQNCWAAIQQEAVSSGGLNLAEKVKMGRSQEFHGWRSRGQRIRSMK